MNNSGEEHNALDGIVHSMLKNEKIASKARGISAAELLEKLSQVNTSEIADLFHLALMLQMFSQAGLLDIAEVFKKGLSQNSSGHREKHHMYKRGEFFAKRYRIGDREKQIITKMIEGKAMKEFKRELNMSESNANKKIRALWKRLGLENRMQLVFVAGWMRLVKFDLGCLESGRK